MADFEEISFVIPGYTPDTIPLDRLIVYLQQFAQLLGDPENMHLVQIKKSSVAPVIHMPKATALAARERVSRVARGDGTDRQRAAYQRIGLMVRRDTGKDKRPALLKAGSQVMLTIPAAPAFEGDGVRVRQATTIDGQLVKIGGVGEDAGIQVVDLQGRTISRMAATRGMAKELAKRIYEPIRLTGIGVWSRGADEQWSLESMQVQSFEPLEDEDASITLEKMRAAKVSWPKNSLDALRNEREGIV